MLSLNPPGAREFDVFSFHCSRTPLASQLIVACERVFRYIFAAFPQFFAFCVQLIVTSPPGCPVAACPLPGSLRHSLQLLSSPNFFMRLQSQTHFPSAAIFHSKHAAAPVAETGGAATAAVWPEFNLEFVHRLDHLADPAGPDTRGSSLPAASLISSLLLSPHAHAARDPSAPSASAPFLHPLFLINLHFHFHHHLLLRRRGAI